MTSKGKSSGKKSKIDEESGSESEEGGEEFEVETILGKKIKKGQVFYHVKWKNYGMDDATWEPADNLSNCPAKIKAYEDSIKDEEKPAKDPPKKRGRKAKAQTSTDATKNDEDKVEDSVADENEKEKESISPHKSATKNNSKRKRDSANGNADKHEKQDKSAENSEAESTEDQPEPKVTKKGKKHSPVTKETVKPEKEDDPEETKSTTEVIIREEPKLETKTSVSEGREAGIKTFDCPVGSPDSENSIKWNSTKKDSKVYGSLEQGDKPLSVKGVRPVPEKNDLEILVAWKPRPDGTQPEDSKVMRIDILKHQHWLPLIEFYESKMKLEKVPNFNPSLLPKV